MILGPVSHHDYPPAARGRPQPSGELRNQLDLYANVRPAARARACRRAAARRSISSSCARTPRASTPTATCSRGSGEFMPTPDVALSVRKITRAGLEPHRRGGASRWRARRRRKVTAVHKANVLRVSDGLFLECVRAVAGTLSATSPTTSRSSTPWRRCWCATPRASTSIVTTNMFGDILSDEASELSGSLGLAASLNAGAEHALAQAQHGSAPDIAGRDIANPASLIRSAAMLLAWLGERRGDDRLVAAGAHRGGARRGTRRAGVAHRRSRRPARHEGVRRARGCGGGGVTTARLRAPCGSCCARRRAVAPCRRPRMLGRTAAPRRACPAATAG